LLVLTSVTNFAVLHILTECSVTNKLS